MIASGKLSPPLVAAAAAFLALLFATTACALPPSNASRASAAAVKKAKPAKAAKGAAQKKPPEKPESAPAGNAPKAPPSPPAAPRTLAPEPPVDTSVPPPLLPRASRERMRACAEEWENKKRATKVGLPMWRDFATGCLTR